MHYYTFKPAKILKAIAQISQHLLQVEKKTTQLERAEYITGERQTNCILSWSSAGYTCSYYTTITYNITRESELELWGGK
jgi:hypothetical protein